MKPTVHHPGDPACTAGRETGLGPPATHQLVVVDDHELVAWALAHCLRSEGIDARHVPVRSAHGVLESAGSVQTGIVLLDLQLGRDDDGGRIDGADLVAPLSSAGWRVLLLTDITGRHHLGAALAAGGFGWVPKTAPFPTLLRAIREAGAGRSTTSPAQRRDLIELHHRRERDNDRLTARLGTLTEREREVLALLAGGLRARSIAEHYTVSLATVRSQIHSVLAKLRVSSQLEAVAQYHRVGIERRL